MNRPTFLLSWVAVLSALPAAAHHSFDLTFDRDELVTVTGTVTEFRFANPHTFFKLAVVGPDGETQEWHVETTSAGTLNDHGWNPRSIEPSEVLAVEGWPARNGTPYIKLRSMSHANGRAVALWLPPGPTMISGG